MLDKRDALRDEVGPVELYDSRDVPGTRDTWIVGASGYPSKEAARAACASFGREIGGGCYPIDVATGTR